MLRTSSYSYRLCACVYAWPSESQITEVTPRNVFLPPTPRLNQAFVRETRVCVCCSSRLRIKS